MQATRSFYLGCGEFVEFGGICAQIGELVVEIAGAPQRLLVGDELVRKRDRGCGLFAIRDGIDKTVFQRRLGIDRLPGQDHRQRLGHADEPRQPLGAAGAGNEAELDFGQAEPGGGRCNAIMTAERDLEPAAQRGSMQGRDHRFGHCIQRRDHIARTRRFWRLVELGDVGAGNESAAGAGQHDRMNRRVSFGALKRVDQPRTNVDIEGIDRWIVDHDDGDAAVAPCLYQTRH